MIIRSIATRIVALSILLLALPLAAWANSVSFQTSGGQITSSGTFLTIKTSTLTSMAGLPEGSVTGNLGWASLTTGVLLSGNAATGATFAAGGSFTLTANGANGIPAGMLFSGTFLSPVTWTAAFNPEANFGQGAWYYTLSGIVRGTLSDGRAWRGNIRFATTDVPRSAQFSSFANLSGGSGQVAVVPEPGTLALLASGLAGVAMLVRRKRRM
jgi:PEP-CTERM motif-containing protein